MLDINHGLSQHFPGDAKDPPLHLELFLNDSLSSICARVLLIFDALYCLGAMYSSRASPEECRAQVVYLSQVMCTHVLLEKDARRLFSGMEELVVKEDMKSLLPWAVSLSMETQSKIKEAMQN